PPRSPPVPYTTLFRSTEGWRVLLRKLEAAEQMQVQLCASAEEPKYLYRGQGRLAFLREMLSYEENVRLGVQALCAERALESEIRSEEHTSELQSRENV